MRGGKKEPLNGWLALLDITPEGCQRCRSAGQCGFHVVREGLTGKGKLVSRSCRCAVRGSGHLAEFRWTPLGGVGRFQRAGRTTVRHAECAGLLPMDLLGAVSAIHVAISPFVTSSLSFQQPQIFKILSGNISFLFLKMQH